MKGPAIIHHHRLSRYNLSDSPPPGQDSVIFLRTPSPPPPPFYWQVSAIQFSIFSLYTPFTLEAMLSPKPSTHPPPPSPPPSYKIMTDPLNQCSVKKK